MDFATIIEKILEHGGPSMMVAIAFLYYLHKQTERKDGNNEKLSEEIRKINSDRINDLEKHLTDLAESRELMKRLIDKTGDSEQLLRDYIERSERNAKEILQHVQDIKNKLN